MQHYFYELLTILNEMSTYLLLGFLISGLLHVYVPKSLYQRFLAKKGFGSVFGAALLGVPLPLCSCGVIPTAVSLKKQGASDGATVSFLVATPQTGVDSILATYSLLGLPFAICRPVIAFIVALFSGITVDKFGTKKSATKKEEVKTEAVKGTKMRNLSFTMGNAADTNPKKFTYAPNAKPTENNSGESGCSCCHSHSKSSGYKFIDALRYGYIDMMQDFGKWLIIGLLAAAAITAFIPDSMFALFKDHYMLNILLILLISAPMYICATGSIPIALSLMVKGISPGAAFVLLLAGPATNVASLVILRKEIGNRRTIIYLLSIIVGAILSALVIDFMLPSEWFTPANSAVLSGCGHDHSHGFIWWQTLSSAIFIIMFVIAFGLKYYRKIVSKR